MNQIPIDCAETKSAVKAFLNFVMHLKLVHYTYTELFDDEQSRNAALTIASDFFVLLSNVLVDYLLLECAKISDPATSNRGAVENFTVPNFVEAIAWPLDVKSELVRINDAVQRFRQFIVPARNKILAHYDKRVYLTQVSLGEFPAGEEKRFIESLEEFCTVMHEAVFGSIVGDLYPGLAGDVLDFKKALFKAVAFDRMMDEAETDELFRLDSILAATRDGLKDE